MKQYVTTVLLILYVLMLVLVLPPLFSAPYWEAVILGFVIITTSPAVLYLILKKGFTK